MTDLLCRRKELLDQAGGIPQPVVDNREWLYLFGEETRHSIMIEWYFSTKKEIQSVIRQQNDVTTDIHKVIMGYFDAASLIYEYGYQTYVNHDPFALSISTIKTVHSLMMKWINPTIGGTWRSWDILITQAQIQPPHGVLVDDAMRAFVDYTRSLSFAPDQLCRSLALLHTYFEATHPFADGNGRVGRILLNYILIAHGYPSIIIKWTQTNKQKYFAGLEAAEVWLRDAYPDNLPADEWDTHSDPAPLATLIERALWQSMDYIILHDVPASPLSPLSDIVVSQWHSPWYARQLVHRWRVIAKKIGKTWYSAPAYFYADGESE